MSDIPLDENGEIDFSKFEQIFVSLFLNAFLNEIEKSFGPIHHNCRSKIDPYLYDKEGQLLAYPGIANETPRTIQNWRN